MDILPLQPPDFQDLPKLQPPDWSDVIPYFEFYSASDFCFPVKVVLDKELVGAGAVIQHNDVGWLAHIIVHQEQRNKGIGGLLTRELIKIAHAKKCRTIYLIATELGAPVYEKAGFVTDGNYLFYKNLTPDNAWEISEKIVPFTAEFTNKVKELDAYISGEDRFFHIRQHLPESRLFVEENRVEGLYLPTFGDGVILARNPFAGTELMKFRLQTKDTASFPADNIAAVTLLSDLSYEPYKQAKCMRLGSPKNWQPQGIYNRIGGNMG